MRLTRTRIAAIGYELPPHVVTSAALDDRLSPVYTALGLGPRQIEPLTGVRERRFWPPRPVMSDGAARAARKALAGSGIAAGRIGMLIYGGVCRDNLEPATACAVADAVGVSGRSHIYDVSNACLGVVNGMVQVASAIELGQVQAGLIVSAETAREIVDSTIEHLLATRDMQTFKTSLATMTGGSGAVAVLLADESLAPHAPRLTAAVARSATQHHRLCRWGPDTGIPASRPVVMETHATDVLEHGVRLGVETWRDFLAETGWSDGVDKVICHQVGSANRAAILSSLRIAPQRDFSTFSFLGNIGTVSLPITAALAAERGFLEPGDRVGFLGIGSGLNCLMLAIEWQ